MKRFVAAAAVASAVGASAVDLSPVTRVAELLQGLTKQIEEEGKAEEKLYKKFVCWGKSTISAKTESNAKADARIEYLTGYIDDVENGRVEFTSERQDLEKELAELNAAIEEATNMRNQENEDFKAAEKEMKQAIQALESAVGVLGDATKDNTGVSFMAKKSHMSMKKVLEVTKQGLSSRDYRFFVKAMNMQPKPEEKDWEQLNKESTFKDKYQTRSTEIQDTLAKMLKTFEGNLEEATNAENTAKETFDKLMGEKNNQKKETENALIDMSKENGARQLSLSEAKTEKTDLEEQVTNDTKFISQTETALSDKKDEWKVRLNLRTQELASISEAISILRSDDSRDLFKKSFESQGYFFTQMHASGHGKMEKALSLIYSTYRKAGASAATMAKVSRAFQQASRRGDAEWGAIGKVISAIDTMVTDLEAEGAEDQEAKETCEADFNELQRTAMIQSREMDDNIEAIKKNHAEVADLTEQIATAVAEIKAMEEELAEATKMRQDENAEWQSSTADDKAAVDLIKNAMAALEKFYADNNMDGAIADSLVQVPAGEAPAPPPSTWDTPYTGKQGESKGVVATLALIKEDIEKDIAKAKADEEEAESQYQTFKSETEASIDAKEKQNIVWEGEIGDLNTNTAERKTENSGKHGVMSDTVKVIESKRPGCNFITVNFQLRKSNRQIEIDGLKKAKTILKTKVAGDESSASFEKDAGDLPVEP
jgi:chromosome segregation ATPase